MADVFAKAKRSDIMRRVRSENTRPELVVADIASSLRFRFRTNDRSLPGTPDLVFARRRKAIFVHGCFWHRHLCESGQSTPADNQSFWEAKFTRNCVRDRRVRRELRSIGWKVLVVWECQTKRSGWPRLRARLLRFLRD